MITIPREAGLTRPKIAVDGLSSAPISTPATTRMTSSPSSTGVSLPTRYVSGRDGPTAKSQTSSTIVWIAMPPIRFPAASARLPEAAAEIVIARSGDREQDQPAELVAQPETRVERVCRLREQDARSPGRGRGGEKDQDEERRAEPGHAETMRAAADGTAPPAALLQVEP